MKTLGNVLWVILVGFVTCLYWILAGVLSCVTIILIPFGLQQFKLARLSLLPFGHTVERGPTRMLHILGNIVWLLLGGLIISVVYLVLAGIFFITIIGIPFSVQCVKLAGLSLWPFGAQVVSDESEYTMSAPGATPVATADGEMLIRPVPPMPSLPAVDGGPAPAAGAASSGSTYKIPELPPFE